MTRSRAEKRRIVSTHATRRGNGLLTTSCRASQRMLSYPAIAEHDERCRRKGDPLFPELKPLDFLLDRKKLLTQPSWESIYQQHPIIVGGGQFPIEKLKVLPYFDRS